MLRLLRDPGLRARLAHAARAAARQWSASVAAEQLLDCYRAIIAARGKTTRAFAR